MLGRSLEVLCLLSVDFPALHPQVLVAASNSQSGRQQQESHHPMAENSGSVGASGGGVRGIGATFLAALGRANPAYQFD